MEYQMHPNSITVQKLKKEARYLNSNTTYERSSNTYDKYLRKYICDVYTIFVY